MREKEADCDWVGDVDSVGVVACDRLDVAEREAVLVTLELSVSEAEDVWLDVPVNDALCVPLIL